MQQSNPRLVCLSCQMTLLLLLCTITCSFNPSTSPASTWRVPRVIHTHHCFYTVCNTIEGSDELPDSTRLPAFPGLFLTSLPLSHAVKFNADIITPVQSFSLSCVLSISELFCHSAFQTLTHATGFFSIFTSP